MTIVVMTVLIVKMENASLCICVAMLSTTVKMDQMREIAVVRTFFMFLKYYKHKYMLNKMLGIVGVNK